MEYAILKIFSAKSIMISGKILRPRNCSLPMSDCVLQIDCCAQWNPIGVSGNWFKIGFPTLEFKTNFSLGLAPYVSAVCSQARRKWCMASGE